MRIVNNAYFRCTRVRGDGGGGGFDHPSTCDLSSRYVISAAEPGWDHIFFSRRLNLWNFWEAD